MLIPNSLIGIVAMFYQTDNTLVWITLKACINDGLNDNDDRNDNNNGNDDDDKNNNVDE